MIVSYKHRFIFVKTVKTAGTSVEISLSRYCGKKDIITPIAEDDEKIRTRFNQYPRNYSGTIFFFLRKYLELKIKGKPSRTQKFWNHMSATDIKKTVGSDIWESYFTFSIVRNPFDEVISRYFWHKKMHNIDLDLDTFIFKKAHIGQNWDIISDGNLILLDYVARYEHLSEEIVKITKKVGIEFDGWMPSAKASIRKNRENYKQLLSSEQIKFIKERAHNIFENFYPELID